MKTIKNEMVLMVDVDGTLIYHTKDEKLKSHIVNDPVTGYNMKVAVNRAHIRLIMEEKARGKFIVVWSKGGYRWAKNVVLGLGLDPFVDLVMTKPGAYVDDVPIQDWLQDRIFMAPECGYKR